MKLIKLISIADLFTLANGLIGMFAIMFIIDNDFKPAMVLLFLAIIMDGLDGAIARRLGSKHSFGIYLDSVSDSISFCFAPVALIYTIYYDIDRGKSYEDIKNFIVIICCSILFILGMLRLARFTYHRQNKLKNYVGLPTPALTLFILCMVIFTTEETFIAKTNKPYYILPIIIIVSILMITEIEYPKIRGKYMMIGLIAVLFGILGVIYKNEFHNIFGIIALFFVILYVVATPHFAKSD